MTTKTRRQTSQQLHNELTEIARRAEDKVTNEAECWIVTSKQTSDLQIEFWTSIRRAVAIQEAGYAIVARSF